MVNRECYNINPLNAEYLKKNFMGKQSEIINAFLNELRLVHEENPEMNWLLVQLKVEL